jgi:hypothetical protein
MSVSSDKDTLHLLSIFHFVMAGLIALVACIPLIHFALGLSMLVGGMAGEEPELGMVGGFFAMIAGAIILVGWGIAFVVFLAGKNLEKQQKYQLCLVAAAMLCVFMPLGTVLGVFTLVTLNNQSVKELFNRSVNGSSELPADSRPDEEDF